MLAVVGVEVVHDHTGEVEMSGVKKFLSTPARASQLALYTSCYNKNPANLDATPDEQRNPIPDSHARERHLGADTILSLIHI